MPIFSLTDFAKEQVQAVQDYSLLAGRSISNLFAQPRYFGDTLMQADLVGVGSLPIVVLTGFFTGAVLALQTSSTLQQFGSLSLTGQLVSLSMLAVNSCIRRDESVNRRKFDVSAPRQPVCGTRSAFR